MLNPSLATNNAFGIQGRRVGEEVDPTITSKMVQHLIGDSSLPGRIAVECFLVLCGFVSSLPGLLEFQKARRN